MRDLSRESSGGWLRRKREEWEGLSPWILIVGPFLFLLVACGTTWWLLNAKAAAYLQCATGYAAAENAADTAVVDQYFVIVISGSRPVSCGTLREGQERAAGKDGV
jgi:hypothetical protein